MMKFKDEKRYLTIDKSEINEYITLVMKARNAHILTGKSPPKMWMSCFAS